MKKNKGIIFILIVVILIAIIVMIYKKIQTTETIIETTETTTETTTEQTTEEFTVPPIIKTTESQEEKESKEKEEIPTEKSSLNQEIQETTTIKYIENEENIPKVTDIKDPMTTTRIEQPTEQTTEVPQPTTKTEPKTEITTKAPTNNKPQMGDKDGNGNIWIDGFGWVKDEGGGSVEEQFGTYDKNAPEWNEIVGE